MSSDCWKTIDEFLSELKSISVKRVSKFPIADGYQFNAKLSASLKDSKFRGVLSGAGILYNWDEETKSLKSIWTMDTVHRALHKLMEQSGPEITEDVQSCSSEGNTVHPPIPKPRMKLPNQICPLPPKSNLNTNQRVLPTSKYRYDYVPSQTCTSTSVHKGEMSRTLGSPTVKRRNFFLCDAKASSFTSRRVLKIRSEYREIMGDNLQMTGQQDYIQVAALLPAPVLSSADGPILPNCVNYVKQQIKLWGVNVLTDENLNQMVSTASPTPCTTTTKIGGNVDESRIMDISEIARRLRTPPAQSSLILEDVGEDCKSVSVSRWDVLTLILASADNGVLEETLRVLAQFPCSLPLIIRNPLVTNDTQEQTFVLLPSMLNKCVIRWEGPGQCAMDNHLFKSPYKLVTALRIGKHEKGKSTILNQIFLNSNLLTCRGRPGGQNGPPACLEGSVEFIWLTPETCKRSVWDSLWNTHYSKSDEVILLANLHGNAVDQNVDILAALSQITWNFIAFVMPDSISNFQENASALGNKLGGRMMDYIFVDHDIESREISTIQLKHLTDNITLTTLTRKINSAITCKSSMNRVGDLNATETAIPAVYTKTSEVLHFLHAVCKIKFENIHDLLCLQKNQSLVTPESVKLWNRSEKLRALIDAFLNVLILPIDERRDSLAVIETEFNIYAKESFTKMEPKLLALLKLQEDHSKSNRMDGAPNVGVQLKNIYKDLVKFGIGLEHLFREIGRLYEMLICSPSSFPEQFGKRISSLPDAMAQLIVEGQTIEILDGDHSCISDGWLNAVCHGVCLKLKGLRVFVVSILGLQSSGKSTLLNALFGCKFPVSVGKCTRGLFMRLLMLEESFAKDLDADALLVLDTEGLGSPENMNDPNSDTKDRLMATFAMSVSNITIVNISGDTQKQVLEILQIVILTLARLEDADLAPDVLLVHHVPDRNNFHSSRSVDDFCSSLKVTIDLVNDRHKELELGVRTCKNLVNLETRVRRNEILLPFHPFKAGASRGAPPSEEYHKDVVKLRQRIFQELRDNPRNQVSFCTWHKLLTRYWRGCQAQNFVLKFQSIKQVQDYLQINASIATVKGLIDKALSVHERALYEFLKDSLMQVATTKNITVDTVNEIEANAIKMIHSHIDIVPNTCDWVERTKLDLDKRPCNWCNKAETERLRLIETFQGKSSEDARNAESSIMKYILEVRNRSKKEIVSFFLSEKFQLGEASGFDTLLDRIIKSFANDKQISSDTVWDALVHEVAKLHPVRSFDHMILEDIYEHYKEQRQLDTERLKLIASNLETPAVSWEQIRLSKAKEIGKLDKFITTLASTSRIDKQNRTEKHQRLSSGELNWLKERIDKIPDGILQDRLPEKYETTLLTEHRRTTDQVLVDFEQQFPKSKLLLEFKRELFYYSLQSVCHRFKKLQDLWNKKHEPYLIMLQRKEDYLKKISFRIDHSKSVAHMGISVVEIILKAASQRARQFGDEGRHAYIQGLDWIQCPESIRLRYFSQLAIQVRDGKIENALKHFDNPKDCIINWFHDEIENGNIEELVAAAHQRFLEECGVLYKSLSRVSNVQELIHLLNDYDYNIAVYSSVSSILQNCRSFLDLKAAILSGFVEKQSVFLDSIKLKSYLASDRPQLMNRLGCLASCPWCGALCWGYKGHEASIQGIGSLGKHHTCHQPQGLAGICYESTGELVFETCESNNKGVVRPDDGNQVVPDFVDRTESFWIFDGGKHPRNEFADLMTWFFLKMHPALAKHHGVAAANFSGNGDLHDLDNRLDSILLWARNGIMM